MTIPENPSEVIEAAEKVGSEATTLRRQLRKAGGPSPQRDAKILPMLDDIDSVMRPLRSFIGHFQYESFGTRTERRATDASSGLQYERKQLKKMLAGPRP